jgi:hypothetical protein
VPALAFMICAYALVQMGKIELSAIVLAMSIGVRITGILFLFPIAIYLYLNHYRILRILSYVLIASSVGFLFYIPILMQDGLGMFKMPVSPFGIHMYLISIIYRGCMLFGPLGSGVLLFFSFRNWYGVKSTVVDAAKGKNPDAIVELVSIALFVVLFIRHPLRTQYLLPVIPFIYLCIARWFSYKEIIVTAVSVMLFGIVTIDLKGGESGERRFAFKIANGVIYQDFKDRDRIEQIRRHIAGVHTNQKSVVLSGMGEILTYQNPNLVKTDWRGISTNLDPHGIQESDNIYKISNGVKDTYLVYSMSKQNIQVLLEEGYSIYYFGDAPAICVYYYGYHPKDFGSKLEISD